MLQTVCNKALSVYTLKKVSLQWGPTSFTLSNLVISAGLVKNAITPTTSALLGGSRTGLPYGRDRDNEILDITTILKSGLSETVLKLLKIMFIKYM